MNCLEHPQREAVAPCVRCGTFQCDWCLKLAPSWGPGLCAACQRRGPDKTAALVPRSRPFMIVGAAVLIGPFLAWNDIASTLPHARQVFEDGHTEQQVGAMVVTLGLEGLLLAWSAAGALLFFLRKRQARIILIGLFSTRLLLNGTAVFFFRNVPTVWIPVVWSAGLLAYFVFTTEVKQLLSR